MGYPQVPTHYPGPEPPRRVPLALVIAAVAAAVALVAAAAGYVGYRVVTGTLAARQRSAAATPTTGPTTGPTIGPTTGPTTPPATVEPTGPDTAGPAPTAVGMVDVTAVAGQDRAVPVAEMFDSYFGGIDSNHPRQALAEYDPAGVVDPADPDQASQFAQATATTNDSAIALVGLGADPTGRGAVQARVLFTSRQAAGYGPPDDPNETCTRWDITYVLTDDPTAGYRILDDARHSDAAC